MTKTIKILPTVLLIFSAFLLSADVFADDQKIRDNQIWAGAEVTVPITKKRWTAEIGQQIRTEHNNNDIEYHISDFGVKYKINSILRASSSLRLKTGADEPKFVWYANIYAKYSLNDLRFTYRLRYQKKFDNTDDNEDYLRQKFTIKHKTKNILNPYLSAELFYRFRYDKGDRFDKFRLYVGSDIKLSKRNSLKVYYLYQQEINRSKPGIQSIYGIFYGYDF